MKKLLLAGIDDAPWRKQLIEELKLLKVVDVFDPLSEMKLLPSYSLANENTPRLSILEVETSLIDDNDVVVLYVNSKQSVRWYGQGEILQRHARTMEAHEAEGRGHRTIFWFPFKDFKTSDATALTEMSAKINKAGCCWARVETMRELAMLIHEHVSTWEDENDGQ